MEKGKKYRILIRRDGTVRYMMEDGSFWIPKNCPQLSIREFKTQAEAMEAFSRWQRRYPATASGWFSVIEEV